MNKKINTREWNALNSEEKQRLIDRELKLKTHNGITKDDLGNKGEFIEKFQRANELIQKFIDCLESQKGTDRYTTEADLNLQAYKVAMDAMRYALEKHIKGNRWLY